MVRYLFVMSLLLSACAQVGTITGGPTDEFAPRVMSESIADKQRNVKTSEQLLVFDEFVKLDQPQQRASNSCPQTAACNTSLEEKPYGLFSWIPYKPKQLTRS